MSKKNNVNPDHYKTAGRERQGEDIIHDVYKRRYAQSKSQAGARPRNFIPGAREEELVPEVGRLPDDAGRGAEGKRVKP
ncbi:MAG: hypothetical protein ACREAM_30450 [Blastocatellia bacterium]